MGGKKDLVRTDVVSSLRRREIELVANAVFPMLAKNGIVKGSEFNLLCALLGERLYGDGGHCIYSIQNDPKAWIPHDKIHAILRQLIEFKVFAKKGCVFYKSAFFKEEVRLYVTKLSWEYAPYVQECSLVALSANVQLVANLKQRQDCLGGNCSGNEVVVVDYLDAERVAQIAKLRNPPFAIVTLFDLRNEVSDSEEVKIYVGIPHYHVLKFGDPK
jgi:hypothetical protein